MSTRKTPARSTPQVAFYVSPAVHALMVAESDRYGLSLATIARKAVLAYLDVNADGTPRQAAKK